LSRPLHEKVDDVGRLKGLSYTGGDACIRSDWFEPAGVELISVAAAGAATTMPPPCHHHASPVAPK
jgi:hypothetical protein